MKITKIIGLLAFPVLMLTSCDKNFDKAEEMSKQFIQTYKELYKYYMKSISIIDVGLTYYTGELAENGKIVKYIEGKTEAELLAEQERIKDEKAEAEAAEEEWRIKGQVAEKNNAIKLLCSKQYKAPNMKVNVSGFVIEHNNPVSLGGKTAPAVMKVYDFGTKGKTIVLYAYVDLEDGSEPLAICSSASGRNLSLHSQQKESGGIYGPSNNLPFGLLRTNVNGEIVWHAILQGGDCVSDVYEGMSETALKMVMKKPLESGIFTFKLVENSAGEKLYVYHDQVVGEDVGWFYFTNNILTRWLFFLP